MRKVTYEAVQALMHGYEYKNNNTRVCDEAGTMVMYLHDNAIAKRRNNHIYVCSCGWETSTTKERLNGIPDVHVMQKAGKWYLNGILWLNSNEWTLITKTNE